MDKNLYTIAILKAKPGQEDQLISILETLAAETRKEEGALDYGFIRDQETPNVVLSYERWRDADAESTHWRTPHLKKAIELFKDVLDGAPVVHKGPRII